MAEYSREDSDFAERILGPLMDGETEGFELEPGLSVSDLQQDALRFRDQMQLLDDLDVPCPAMRVADETVPASLEATIGNPGFIPGFWSGFNRLQYWRQDSFAFEVVRSALHSWYERPHPAGYTTIDRGEARAGFARRAMDFLTGRVAAVRSWHNGGYQRPWQGATLLNLPPSVTAPPMPTPGCHFTVSTLSNGLRVFWSGAYYISPNNFNSPTSPTTSVLQAGTYIFGVDGGAYGNKIQWDQNLVISLPGRPFAQLNF